VRKLLALLIGACVLAPVGCQSLNRTLKTKLNQLPPRYLHTVDVAARVLERHFPLMNVDKVHGVIQASSPVRANLYTKYRTRAEGRVMALAGGDYDVQVRVVNELEVSEPTSSGRGQPNFDWRAVGFDHVLEAAIMTEIQAELQGQTITASQKPSYNLFTRPSPPPLRHRDLLRPPVPDPKGNPAPTPKPTPKPEAKTLPPSTPSHAVAPQAPRRAQLCRQYLALGDLYAKRREHKKAVLEYQRATLVEPARVAPHLSLANAFTALERYDAAAAALRAAARSANGKPLAAADLQRLRGLPHDLGQRVLLLKGWCKKNPADGNARLVLGYHCLLADRTNEARNTLNHILEANPQDPTAKFFIRQVALRQS